MFAFSARLVQTLVQTGVGVAQVLALSHLRTRGPLIVDLGVTGSSPVSHPACDPLPTEDSGLFSLTGSAVTRARVGHLLTYAVLVRGDETRVRKVLAC